MVSDLFNIGVICDIFHLLNNFKLKKSIVWENINVVILLQTNGTHRIGLVFSIPVFIHRILQRLLLVSYFCQKFRRDLISNLWCFPHNLMFLSVAAMGRITFVKTVLNFERYDPYLCLNFIVDMRRFHYVLFVYVSIHNGVLTFFIIFF